MKKVKIHFTRNGYEDDIVIEGDTNEEIRIRADAELLKRGIPTEVESVEKYNLWSEDIP